MMKALNDVELQSLGKYRDINTVIRNRINDREHTVTDAEHGACKFGMAVSSVHSSSSRSEVPKCATGYSWPLPYVRRMGRVQKHSNCVGINSKGKTQMDNYTFEIASQFMLLEEEEFYQRAGSMDSGGVSGAPNSARVKRTLNCARQTET